jgi:hypothetical protein
MGRGEPSVRVEPLGRVAEEKAMNAKAVKPPALPLNSPQFRVN